MRTSRCVVLVGALALAASACGSSGTGARPATAAGPATSTIAPPTTAITRGAFLARANAICKETERKVRGTGGNDLPGGGSPSDHAYARAVNDTADVIEGDLGSIQALPQPPGDEAALQGVYAGYAEKVRLSRAYATALTNGDTGALDALAEQYAAVDERTDAAAQQFGLVSCS